MILILSTPSIKLDVFIFSQLKKEATKPKIDPKADLLSSILPDTTDQHGKHLFDSNCSVCTGKIVTHPESSVTSKTTVSHGVISSERTSFLHVF